MFTDPKKLGFTFALSLVTAWLGLRFGMLMDMRSSMAAGFSYAVDHIGSDILARPFAFALGDAATLAALFCFIAPWAVFAYLAAQEGNFDPGKEHGDARWATKPEMTSLCDPDHTLNNRVVSEHHQQVLNRRGTGKEGTEITRRMSDRNANTYVLGTSGSRKTVSICTPALLNCIDEPTAVRLLTELGDKKGLGMLGKGVAKNPDPACSGADLFMTDPKGDTVRSCGQLLVDAGVDVRCFNSVDFSQSCRMNPFSYIPVRTVDSVDPFGIDMRVKIEVEGEEPVELIVDASGAKKADAGENDGYLGSITIGESPVIAHVRAPEYTTHDTGLEDTIDEKSLSKELRIEYLEAGLIEFDPEIDDDEYNPANRLKTADEVKSWSRYKQMVHGISYRTTDIDFAILLKNESDDVRRVRVTYDLPSGFEFRDYLSNEVLESESLSWNEQRRRNLEGYARYTYEATLGNDPYDPEHSCSDSAMTISGGPRPGRTPDGAALVSTVNCLVKNFSPKQDKNTDPFWENAEMLLFQALVAYLIERWDDPRYWTLPEVMDLLQLADVAMDKSKESDLDRIIRYWETGMQDVQVEAEANPFGRRGAAGIAQVPTEHGPHPATSSLAVHCYNCFKQAAPETIQSILISCNNTLVKLFPPELRDVLSEDELELDRFGEPGRKKALFLISSDTDDTYDFLTAVITYLTVKFSCENAAKKYGGRLPRQLHMVFDEFSNVGVLPGFPRTIAVTRSRNIAITICLQSMSQATKNYSEEDAKTIQNNCSTVVFLAGSDEKTLEAFRKLIGDETVHEKSRSETKGQQHSRSETRQSMARPLCSESQLRRLDVSECVVLTQGLMAIKDKKYPLAKHPLYPYIDPSEGSNVFRAAAGDKGNSPRARCVYEKKFDYVAHRNAMRKRRLEEAGQTQPERYKRIEKAETETA